MGFLRRLLDSLTGIAYALERIRQAILRVERAIVLAVPPKLDHIALGLVAEKGARPMQVLQDQKGFSDMKLTVTAFIPLADGSGAPDPDRPVAVESSAPDQVGVEMVDGAHFFITTPLDQGEATITISAPRAESVQFKFSYAPPVLDQINVAIGAEVPDT